MNALSVLLDGIAAGNPRAAKRLLPLVYDELRRLASAKLAAERPGQTLDATALVHEAYLRLAGPDNEAHFANRRHFFAAAAEAMRRILVENARRKKRLKHGGELEKIALSDPPAAAPAQDLIALDEALRELSDEDPLAAKVVELRHFAGLGHEQVADTLGITVYLARQKWTFARAWLRTSLAD
jgi:RNA polymerase sigma factor (TIGR02999 family)